MQDQFLLLHAPLDITSQSQDKPRAFRLPLDLTFRLREVLRVSSVNLVPTSQIWHRLFASQLRQARLFLERAHHLKLNARLEPTNPFTEKHLA